MRFVRLLSIGGQAIWNFDVLLVVLKLGVMALGNSTLI
jgi:hypothetical protein